jgi:methionyl-tRNA formyltransferase
MKIIFFGTPQFAAQVLDKLMEHKLNIVAVVTKPDRPKGRSNECIPTPVKQVGLAQIPPLPIYQPEIVSAPDFAPILAAFEADVFVVVAYGEILKQHLLDMPRLGCINLHASLLPKFRGAAPIHRSIVDGETETGVTIMHMVKKMDARDIIKTAAEPIGPDTNCGELEEALCEKGADLLIEVLREFEQGIIRRTPQDHALVTYAAKVELEDGEVLWTSSAQKMHNRVRGLTPHPGAWCFVTVRGEKKRLKIIKTRLEPNMSGEAGEILSYGKDGIVVACGNEALRILEIQLEGKRRMTADEFSKGLPIDYLSFQS